MFTNDIVGSSLGGNGVRDPHTVRVFSEGRPDERDRRRGDDPAQRSAARTTRRHASSPATSKEVAESSATGMQVRIIYRRDRYLRGGDHIPFLERGYPAVRFTEVNEDYRHQHQDVRIEDGVQFGDLLQFVDFGYTTRVAKVNARRSRGSRAHRRRPRT